MPLAFQPGTKWRYSTSIDVLGRLAEIISGMPFDQFLAERHEENHVAEREQQPRRHLRTEQQRHCCGQQSDRPRLPREV